MRKEIKNVVTVCLTLNLVIAMLAIIIIVLSVINYQNDKEKRKLELAIQEYEAVIENSGTNIEDDMLKYAFLAGQYSEIVESYREESLISDEDYAIIRNITEEFLKRPTYGNTYQVFEKSKAVFEKIVDTLY